MNLQWLNLRLGRISRWLWGGSYSSCLRCGTTWNCVREHATDYMPGKSCSPLCQKCWWELGSAGRRMPYYWIMWRQWNGIPELKLLLSTDPNVTETDVAFQTHFVSLSMASERDREEWRLIRDAVIREGEVEKWQMAGIE